MYIDSIADGENKMRSLVDTSAAMSTYSKVYHQYVMYQYPRMIAEYLERGVDTKYDMVQLLTSLDLKETYQPVDYGRITTVIRYRIP